MSERSPAGKSPAARQGGSSSVARWRFGESLGPLRELLGRGGVLAIPTESSYGLAADPRSEAGVAEIYRVKQRDPVKPLPVVVADLEQAAALGVDVTHASVAWAKSLWPAPLTLLAPMRKGRTIELPAAAGSSRLAVRIPAHPQLRELLLGLGHGLTATSANQSGEAPMLDPDQVSRLLTGHPAIVVDGGRLPGGEPSTVVGWREGSVEVVRAGRYHCTELSH